MIVRNSFGVTADGRQVDIFTLRNSSETSVDIITYGATINSILVPDRTANSQMCSSASTRSRGTRNTPITRA